MCLDFKEPPSTVYIASYVCVWLQNRCTPLYTASTRGFSDVVNSLLAANANPNSVCVVSYFIATCVH